MRITSADVDRVRKDCHWICRNGILDADEIAQRTLIRAWKFADKIPAAPMHRRNWLNKLAVQEAWGERRRLLAKKRSQVFVGWEREPAWDGPTPETHAFSCEALAIFADALGRSDANTQRTVELVYGRGMNQVEAGAALGVTRQAVALRLKKLMAKVRRRLEK